MSTDLMVHSHLEGLSRGDIFEHEGKRYVFIRYVVDSKELSATPLKPMGATPVRIEYMYEPYKIDFGYTASDAAERMRKAMQDMNKRMLNSGSKRYDDDDGGSWKAPAVGDDDDCPVMGDFDEEG